MKLVKVTAYISHTNDTIVYLNIDNITSIADTKYDFKIPGDYMVKLIGGSSYIISKADFNKILKASFIKETKNVEKKTKKKKENKKTKKH